MKTKKHVEKSNERPEVEAEFEAERTTISPFDPDTERCVNPRYSDRTVAEATQLFMQSKKKSKKPTNKS